MDCAKEWLIWPSFITRPGSLLLDQACDNGLAPSNEVCWSLFGNGCYASLHMSGTSQGVKRSYLGHKIILCNTIEPLFIYKADL